MPRVVALAGGSGGAKLADGLYQLLPRDELTVIVNVGDDFTHFGLHISPDLDTVCYTLAGLVNPQTGWGLEHESWQALESVGKLGGPTWFQIGDRDLGTHLERTRRLQDGVTLTTITRDFCSRWGIRAQVLPATDNPVETFIHTRENGTLPFQEYFVHLQCAPRVTSFSFHGIEYARPTAEVIKALTRADLVIICPSNPWVSIGPILAIPEIMPLVRQSIVVAVSPIIAGKALKGPAAKMYQEIGIEPSALSVAQHYGDLLTGFVLDEADRSLAKIVDQSGIISLVAQTVMKTRSDRRQLAETVLSFGDQLHRRMLLR